MRLFRFLFIFSLSLCCLLEAWLILPVNAKSFTSAPQTKSHQVPVIIIGAGMAGLAAAQSLQQQGIRSLVLEARDRIGGRTWSTELSPDLTVDLGASWIHGIQDNPLYDLSQTLKLKTFVSQFDKTQVFQASGEVLDSEPFAQWSDQLEDYLEQQAAKIKDQSIALSYWIDVFAKAQSLNQSERGYLDFIVNTWFEQEYAADSDRLSMQAWRTPEPLGDDVLIQQGYRHIIEYLTQNQDIALNQAVTEIIYDASGVLVKTQTGQSYQAQRVIVTVPIGVLKQGKIRFIPELPEPKLAAIERLGNGLLNKVYLQFDQLFWPADLHLIQYQSPSPPRWSQIFSFYPSHQVPVLMLFTSGRFAQKLETLSDDETIHQAMQVLRRIYGPNIPDPIAYQITRWGQDPWSLGSYSYLAVGSHLEDYHLLAMPVADRLYFAGEATHMEYPSTAHGAYLSGQRAACEVTESLKS